MVAATSMVAGEGPRVSSREEYTRAYFFTAVVAASMRAFGENEVAARLPAFFCSLAAMLVAFHLCRLWFGTLPALFTVAYMAMEPLSVKYGSFARFYAPAQLFGLIGVLALDRFFLAAAGVVDRVRGALRDALLWGAGAGIAFLASLSLQILTADLLLGFAGFAALRVAIGLARSGPASQRWPELAYLGLGATATLLVLLSDASRLNELQETAFTTASWNYRAALEPLYYVYGVRSLYPLEWMILPVSALLGFLRGRRAGLLVLCLWFFPLAFHSIAFRPRSMHYMLLVLPFFFMLSGLGLTTMVRALFRTVATPWPVPARRLALVILILFFLRSSPWVGATPAGQDWRGAVERIREESRPEDVVIGAVDDDVLLLSHYLGEEVDAQLATRGWIIDELDHHAVGSVRAIDSPDPGAAVVVYDVPALTTAEQVLASLPRGGRGWVVARAAEFHRRNDIGNLLENLRARSVTWFEQGGIVALLLAGPAEIPPPPVP